MDLNSVKVYKNNFSINKKCKNSSVYTLKEIADILGVCEGTARNIVKRYDIPRVPCTKNILVPIVAFNNWYRNEYGSDPVFKIS